MTAEAFRKWLQTMKLSDSAATAVLGIGSRNTIARYRREGAPKHIGLACAAYAAGFDEWGSGRSAMGNDR